MSQHQVIPFQILLEIITHVFALGYPLSKSFPQVTNPRLSTMLFLFELFRGLNPRLSTRLFHFKFLSKVFNPHLRTRLFLFKSFFEFITYISALGSPFSKFFLKLQTHVLVLGYSISYLSKVFTYISTLVCLFQFFSKP